MSVEFTIETFDQWALVVAGAVIVVSLVYLLMAMGWRRGEYVWGGRHPRRLPPELRRLSLLFGILLIVASGIVALLSGELSEIGVPDQLTGVLPVQWERSASFVTAVFFAFAGLGRLVRGAKLERILFGPLMLVAAAFAALLGFGSI